MAVVVYGVTLILCTSVVAATTCYRREIDWIAYDFSDNSYVYKQSVSDYCSTSSSCCGSYCCYYYDDTYYDTYSYSYYDTVSGGEAAAVTVGCIVGLAIVIFCIRMCCLCDRGQNVNRTRGTTNIGRINVSYVTGTALNNTVQTSNSNNSPSETSVDLRPPCYSELADLPPSYEDVIKSTMDNQRRNEHSAPRVNLGASDINTSTNVTQRPSCSELILTLPSPRTG